LQKCKGVFQTEFLPAFIKTHNAKSRTQETDRERLENAIFTLSEGNFDSHRSKFEKEQLGQLGLYYKPRIISKIELK